MTEVLKETSFTFLGPKKTGKVRDIYEQPERLILVTTDRHSSFDRIIAHIPHKGQVLNQVSAWWFEKTKDIVPNHLISTEVADFPLAAQKYAGTLAGRTILVRRANVIPFECVVRGYLSGSALKEYCEDGTVCGERLPLGLQESDELPEPLFTPATKATSGHDENISIERMAELVGTDVAERLKSISVALYERAVAYALTHGIIIADTKFEFGYVDGVLTLIDEALTPDSSRFWPADDYEPGRGQRSVDKQYVRDYLESIGWDKQPPVPPLSDEVIAGTSQRYLEAYERLVGMPLL